MLTESELEQVSSAALPTLEDLAIQKELSDRLLAAVEQLPPRQQTALKGRYFAFMTNREIAEQMNCTENDVKYYVRSGKQKLEKLLKKLYGKNGNYRSWVFAPFLPGMLKTFSKQMSAGHAVNTQGFIAKNSVRPLVAVITTLCIITGVGAGLSLFYQETNLLDSVTGQKEQEAVEPEFDVHISSAGQPAGTYVTEQLIFITSKNGLPVKEVRMDGIPVKTSTQDTDGKLYITVERNGTYFLEIESENHQVKTGKITVSCIDRTPPSITQYRCIGTTLELKFQDARSGVDYTSICALLPDGTSITPQANALDPTLITFADISFPVTIYMKDQLGNARSYYCQDPQDFHPLE